MSVTCVARRENIGDSLGEGRDPWAMADTAWNIARDRGWRRPGSTGKIDNLFACSGREKEGHRKEKPRDWTTPRARCCADGRISTRFRPAIFLFCYAGIRMSLTGNPPQRLSISDMLGLCTRPSPLQPSTITSHSSSYPHTRHILLLLPIFLLPEI